jgi:hypothetical protein
MPDDVGAEPRWQETEALWSQMRSLLERLLAAPRSVRMRGGVPPAPGIYLFSDGDEYRYVGQTRNLRTRLGQHTRPSGTHNSATLAFLIAKEDAAERGVDVRLYRAALQADPDFAECFTRAKAQVASWDVQFIQVDDPNVRTVFEVYVHLALETDLNDFETH